MKKHTILNTLVILAILFFYSPIAFAKQKYKRTLSEFSTFYVDNPDSLLNEFEDSIYNSIYDPKFWAKSYVATFTILKIDVDDAGKIKSMNFSDSADTLFLKAFAQRKIYHDDKLTLEKYAKAKSYKNISILIPIIYEPSSNASHSFSYSQIELLMKYNKQNFTGKALLLPPIKIQVLAEHNM